MSQAPTLSAPVSQTGLASIEAQEKLNVEQAKLNTLGAAATFGSAAFLLAVCPPVGLSFAAATMSAAVGTVFAAKLGGNLLTQKTLESMKKHLGHPAFASQVQKRARKLYKFAQAAGLVAGLGAFVALGALVTTMFAPALALPVLYQAGLAAFGGGMVAAMAARDTGLNADTAGAAVAAAAPAVTPAPELEEAAAPGALRRLPSLRADFSASKAAKPFAPAFIAPANDAPALNFSYAQA